MLLGPILTSSNFELLSLTSSELSLDTGLFLQFIQGSESLKYRHVYEVGGEKGKLEVAFESLNTNRFEQGLKEVFVDFHGSNDTTAC